MQKATRALAHDPHGSDVGKSTIPFARLAAVGFVVLLAGSAAPHVAGLTERLFLASALLWMLVTALELRQSLGVDGGPLAGTSR